MSFDLSDHRKQVNVVFQFGLTVFSDLLIFLVSVFSLLLFSFSAIVYPLSDPGLSFCMIQNLICKLWHSADSITGKEKIYTDF